MKIICVLTAAAIMTGCVHSIHQQHVGDFSPYQANGKEIEVLEEQTVVLGFVFNTDYIDNAYHKLMDQCPNGKVVAVSSQLSTSLKFFHYTNKAYLRGRCV